MDDAGDPSIDDEAVSRSERDVERADTVVPSLASINLTRSSGDALVKVRVHIVRSNFVRLDGAARAAQGRTGRLLPRREVDEERASGLRIAGDYGVALVTEIRCAQ